MKKKLLVVLLCVVMFIAGCVVTGLSWRSDAAELEKRNAQLEVHADTMEAMLQNSNDRIAELTAEVTELKLNLLKLGVDAEELLGE